MEIMFLGHTPNECNRESSLCAPHTRLDRDSLFQEYTFLQEPQRQCTSGSLLQLVRRPDEVDIGRKRTSTPEELDNLISLRVLTSSGVSLSLPAFSISMCGCYGRYSF